MRTAVIAAALAGFAPTASAQAVWPMTIETGSFAERFLVKLEVSNPYAEPKVFSLSAQGPDGAPVEVWTAARQFVLAAGARRRVLITAPFDGAQQRELLICAETTARETPSARIRGQVCAKVRARRY